MAAAEAVLPIGVDASEAKKGLKEFEKGATDAAKTSAQAALATTRQQ